MSFITFVVSVLSSAGAVVDQNTLQLYFSPRNPHAVGMYGHEPSYADSQRGSSNPQEGSVPALLNQMPKFRTASVGWVLLAISSASRKLECICV